MYLVAHFYNTDNPRHCANVNSEIGFRYAQLFASLSLRP
jgi:hypothetical protein